MSTSGKDSVLLAIFFLHESFWQIVRRNKYMHQYFWQTFVCMSTSGKPSVLLATIFLNNLLLANKSRDAILCDDKATDD